MIVRTRPPRVSRPVNFSPFFRPRLRFLSSHGRSQASKGAFAGFGTGSEQTSPLSLKPFPNAAAFYACIRPTTGGGIASRAMVAVQEVIPIRQ